ncbi:IMV membrane protein A13L, partial [Monkeypox virus]
MIGILLLIGICVAVT